MKPICKSSLTGSVLMTILLLIGLTSVAHIHAQDDSPDITLKNWHQWRGPLATGVAPQANPPLTWNDETNIRWKAQIDGFGHATPIIWNDAVFILTAVAAENNPMESPIKYQALRLERSTGKTVWQKTLREEVPHEGTHRDASFASNSPTTDGEHLFAYFGSRGLYCLDFDGNLIWETDFGNMQTRRGFGEGSSPALHDNTLIINWDHEEQSFIVALDKITGKELWRKLRDERTSWSTPLIRVVDGKPQVIVSATNATRSYDLKTGDILWQSTGMTVNSIPSPVEQNGIVYVMSGFRGSALQAIRLTEARGDVTANDNQMLWGYDRDTPYVPSPLLYGDLLYFLKVNKGVLTVLDINNGSVAYGPQRLDEIPNIYASPVGAANRVYLTAREGATLVLENSPEYKVLAINKLDDRFDASAAIAGDQIFLRGQKTLYCIGE